MTDIKDNSFPRLLPALEVNTPALERLMPSIQRGRLVRRLMSLDDDPVAAALAAYLGDCQDEKPCFSGACPVCGAGFQRYAVGLADRFITKPARGILRGRMSMATIVPSSGCVGPDELTADVLHRVLADIAAALVEAKMPACIVGLDISFNEDETGRVPPHWCAHGHGDLLDWPSEAQVAALRRAVPPSAFTKRPVHVEHLDDDERGRAYPFKLQRVRRVTYLDSSVADRKPFRNTHRRELRPEQQVALAKVEHAFGLMRRVMIHGIDADEVKRALDGL